jgi:hypothetical protein
MIKNRGLVLPVAVLVAIGAAQTSQAEPAWGGNCLSCHDQWERGSLVVISEDRLADPDESATGAPDRGTLQVFRATPGQLKTLYAEVVGLDAIDTYAVELTRLRHPGVENGGILSYQADCNWAEWGEQAKYYTDPFISFQWGSGPTIFVFYIEVAAHTPVDYYDLVFALAGKHGSDSDLFYDEQHFYLRVHAPGDLNDDGAVNMNDYVLYAECMAGPGASEAPAGCEASDFRAADIDEDGDVDLDDFGDFAVSFVS